MMHRPLLMGMAAGYVVLMGVLVFGLLQARVWVAQTYDTPEATENWQKLTQSLEQRQNQGRSPVKRPRQRSDQPPIKILFSENFPAIVAWSLVIMSILYWSVGIMIAGALRTPSHQPASADADAPPRV
ncbi:hypothetical protein [Bremerella alba]|uniref:Uncharacterized protein n=1 Tax=Bremerella alba TaxID=980252 RepID=A0A7V9A7U2_9BACT|nr:hypothetical protein [Bremerella alba]MBA2115628.1 hypothetical protein [Bremerella alba]